MDEFANKYLLEYEEKVKLLLRKLQDPLYNEAFHDLLTTPLTPHVTTAYVSVIMRKKVDEIATVPKPRKRNKRFSCCALTGEAARKRVREIEVEKEAKAEKKRIAAQKREDKKKKDEAIKYVDLIT